MIVSEKVKAFYGGGSAIRKMFEEGLRLKALHGAEHVADLSIGNPAFPPPPAFARALRHVATGGFPHAYMPNAGYPYVREKVAASLNAHGYLSGAGGEHVVMTTGAAGALNVVLKTLLNPGDEVIVPRPYFFEYRSYIDNHGGTMVLVDLREDFGLDVRQIAEAVGEKTRAVIITSPHNPTGRVYDRATLAALAAMLTQRAQALGRRLFLVSDETYREVLFDGTPFVSPASCYPDSFLCYSWSKAFSIPGERIGYVAVNPAMAPDEGPPVAEALAMCNRMLGFVNAPALMQHVVAEALDAEIDVGVYQARRDRLCAALDEAGYAYVRPEGAFYLFPRTPGPEAVFVERARAHLLLVVPGTAFGLEGYFRLAFAGDDATVELACRKLEALAAVPA